MKMKKFKIDYKVNDYTPDYLPEYEFDRENDCITSVHKGIKHLVFKDYVLNIRVGDYRYPIDKIHQRHMDLELEQVMEYLLGIRTKDQEIKNEEDNPNVLLGLEAGDKMISYGIEALGFDEHCPVWFFVYQENSDKVKVYVKEYVYDTLNYMSRGRSYNIRPPWEIIEGEYKPLEYMLCSKKQIVTEFYQMYLKMAQDLLKVYPEYFEDGGFADYNYARWKERMAQYRAVIQAM